MAGITLNNWKSRECICNCTFLLVWWVFFTSQWRNTKNWFTIGWHIFLDHTWHFKISDLVQIGKKNLNLFSFSTMYFFLNSHAKHLVWNWWLPLTLTDHVGHYNGQFFILKISKKTCWISKSLRSLDLVITLSLKIIMTQT